MNLDLEGFKNLTKEGQQGVLRSLRSARKTASEKEVKYLFIMPKGMKSYLDWRAELERVSVAWLLRSMIEYDMLKDKQFKKKS